MGASSDWAPPTRFGEYEIGRPLGRGGMGQVYLGHDTLLDRPVAIKFMLRPMDVRARERFLVEARAAARIQHPNVVTVYAFGEVDGRPYIVSELIRGNSLDRLARPVRQEQLLAIGIALARGLAAAHRRNVLHRDIKAANAILGDDGVVKLCDFGIAKLADGPPRPTRDEPRDERRDGPGRGEVASPDVAAAADPDRTLPPVDGEAPPDDEALAAALTPSAPPSLTQVGSVMGTPHYVAPELWLGDSATARSDVYALGALLYELAVGALPHASVPVAALCDVVPRDDAPPVAERAPALTAALAAIIDRCLARDRQLRFASAVELWNALEDLELGTRPVRAQAGNPYRGLLPFDEEHAALFFGRTADVRLVLDRLRAEPFVLVAGDSGVGKSSLCRAGVLPLCRDGLGGGRIWTAATLVPGARPLDALASALAAATGTDEDALLAELAADPVAAVRGLRRRRGDDGGLVVYVDQLEELITIALPAAAIAAGTVLAELARGGPGLRLLAAVRGDYVTRVAALPGIGAEIGRALQLIRPLDEDALREVIIGPARATGVDFESDALVDALIGASGSLPLLQFTLAELWERRDPARGLVTAAALDRLGGVAGALSRHADGVLQGLGADERTAAQHVLSRLVSAHGTRARRTVAELAGGAAVRAALEALVRGRLLVVRGDDGDATYELAHEALLTGWSALAGWLTDASHERMLHERIAGAASEWHRLGEARSVLWGTAQLAQLRGRTPAALAPAELAFLRASQRAVRRRRALVAAFALALVLGLGGAYFLMRAAARRDIGRRVALHLDAGVDTFARASAAQAEVSRAIEQAHHHFRAGEPEAGEERWLAALEGATSAHHLLAESGRHAELALGLEPRKRHGRTLLADSLLARARLAEQVNDGPLRDELLDRLAVYDDGGARLRGWRQPARIEVSVVPASAELTLARFVASADGVRRLENASDPITPGVVDLEPGSYLFTARAAGRAEVRYPLAVTRAERLAITIDLPPATAVPDDFVYIPAGRFLFGSGNEALRTFYETAPLHLRHTDAFLIARHETTFGEWLTFLDDLPPAERAVRVPKAASAALRGTVALVDRGAGVWELAMQPTTDVYRARLGEPISYPERTTRASQDWRRFPATGVVFEDIVAYTGWLDRTGRVPGARLCREDEWERATRGADDRTYPHGDRLDPDQANHDRTYGRKTLAYGPDEVGSHPGSRSPFGLEDTTGNAFELVVSVIKPNPALVARGGAYYFDRDTAAAPNRMPTETSLGDPTLGFRVCATPPR